MISVLLRRPSSVTVRGRIIRCMSTTLKPWRQPVVESNGDYEEEMFLELSDKPLYLYQRDLPRLPVPSLQDTVERFLPTALPLAETPEEEDSLRHACRDFTDQAQHLQERLLQKASSSPSSSWLQLWWNTLAYLQFRDPVVMNVSYFFNLPDDPTLSRTSHVQVKRGASVLKAAWEYRQRVCSGELPQETMGKSKTPLCSVGLKYLFHSCRIPKMVQDSYKLYDPSVYTHAVVACRGQFFFLPMIDEEGNEYSLQALESALEKCLAQADEQPSLELGLLTTSDRDKCAHARNELLRIGGSAMEDALELLESGMLLLCLDDEEPYSTQQCAQHYWHGGGSHNRWYDKNIQLIVPKNGKLGYVGEHAMMDGMPAMGLSHHIMGCTYSELQSQERVSTTSSGTPIVQNIFEPVLEKFDDASLSTLRGLVEQAKSEFLDVVDFNEMHVQSFQGYGTNFIKSSGFSPDAYVQIAIQVATSRLFGRQAATYESTQVRPFLHGRTETTRTVSLASHAFVKAMGLRPLGDEHHDTAEVIRARKLLSLLKEATESHVTYSRLASQAQGVDRHLMGLALVLQEGEELPALLSHPLHARSKTWRVSTSTLPGMSPGFGPVCDTGVGIGYDIKADSCIFSVSSMRHHGWTEPLYH